uniref:E3 ubiquitin-protein ligase RNF213 n=1 Tax=Sus scrofa TaxID=9823 RepID=A0A8D0SA66_PIG
MRCPSCQHLSKDVAAKFCSQCGHKLLPAAPGAASENKLTAPSAPEGGAECGRELMDSSPFSSLGPGNGQENPDEHCSDASLQIQRGAASEGFMDAADGTSHELEAASPSASKRRKEDAALTKVSDVSSPDPKQANGAAAEPAGPEKGPGKEVKDQTKETKQPRASVPASRDHRQETQTKDQTAVPGGKAGENEKASLKPKKEPKKPEGNNKNNAAAEKNAKEQRNERTGELSPKESPLSSEEGVTVCFHAIISKHFEFNPSQHQVFVRGGEEFGKPKWKRNVCEMYYTRDLHELGSLVEGSAVIARQHLDKPIPYKYVLQKGKGAVEYEFIYKPQQKESEPVNRCLQVKSSLLGSGDWHQYDDIICMNPPGAWQTFKDRFTDGTRKDLVKGKQTAAAIMLDSIFSILETWNAINLKSFFTQFQQFYSVIRVPMIYEGKAQPWSTLEYEEKEVKKHLWECLTKKMEPFLKTSGDPLPKDCPVRSKLRMGLIILFSVEKFHIHLSKSDLTSLCHLLCSDPSSPHELHSDLIHILEIKHSWRNSLVNLCQRCMDGEVDLWVCTLPVLHLCMEPSPPTKDAGVQPEDTWAALEGISFSEFREKKSDRKQLVQLMGKNRHLLSVDARLFRSWFSLLPLRTLVCYMRECSEYLSRFPSHILDCLLGTCYRLQELKGPLTNLEVGRLPSAPESWLSRSRPPAGQSQLGGAFSENLTIKSILQMLLSLLDTYQHKMLEEPLIQSYLTVCLKLHETTCRITKDHTFYEMPALSAEIVCRIIILKPLVDSAGGQHSEAGEKNSVATVFQGTLAATRSWFQRVFQNRVFQTGVLSSNVRFTYPEEIKQGQGPNPQPHGS